MDKRINCKNTGQFFKVFTLPFALLYIKLLVYKVYIIVLFFVYLQQDLEIFFISFSLRETDPVVQFVDGKMMQVNYSPRLVSLIREVRQLGALEYRIPSNIEETSEHAKKFIKHAKILEQVCKHKILYSFLNLPLISYFEDFKFSQHYR